MEKTITQPLLFEPLYRERVWGGRRLESSLGKKLPPGKRIGESWEIVDREDAQSIVRHGPFCGRTLHELWRDHRAEIFGEKIPDAPRFPIFAKLLDAREKLSLQVHPPAGVAAATGGETKTEMWYLLAADPGAELLLGLRRGVSRAHFERAVTEGDVSDCVHRVAAKTGDAFFVPSGRLHAIGGGNLIVEIQQNSDTTFRVFDWNRRDEYGKARALHLEDALRSIDFEDFEPRLVRPNDEVLVSCREFVVEKWSLTTPRSAREPGECALFVCLTGAISCGGVQMRAGDFFLIPASGGAATFEPLSAATSLLRVTLPSR